MASIEVNGPIRLFVSLGTAARPLAGNNTGFRGAPVCRDEQIVFKRLNRFTISLASALGTIEPPVRSRMRASSWLTASG